MIKAATRPFFWPVQPKKIRLKFKEKIVILDVQNVSKIFLVKNHELKILKDVNLQIKQPQTISIMGESGSGKTTLLSILAGLEPPTSGQIKINNQDITKLTESDMTRFRGQNIGIIFQNFHLLPQMTALQNVKLPLELSGDPQAEKKAIQLLEQVGLKDRLEHLPLKLSGGEKQRVAIARALSTQPKILLADEPSGSLDVETGEKITDLLFSLIKEYNMTAIMVTHSQPLADRCQTTYLLKNGQLQQ